jgi:hypothetical protein
MSYLRNFLKQHPKKVTDASIAAPLHEIRSLIPDHALPNTLLTKLKAFDSMLPNNQIKSFPNVYLEIERFLTTQKDISFNQQSFRQTLLASYPFIKEYEPLHVVFVEDQNWQRILISEL